ncbi:Uncharacterized protein ABJ99_3279 [Pseudomonas syringae pv. cilantro]|uniref:Uncharacterized protein n=1 Tax=Pseudomonas syringae pv. cilantro TaxID=81035 RepID=A0A0N0X7S8_PSESX|nr:Uncharacterized protein ABJ99_3279 [Pseudomonas syringae pv. cilantro]
MFWRRNIALPSGVLQPNIKTTLVREIRRNEPAQAFGVGDIGAVDLNLASRRRYSDIGHPRRLNSVARLPGIQGGRNLLLAALHAVWLQGQDVDQGSSLRSRRRGLKLFEYR